MTNQTKFCTGFTVDSPNVCYSESEIRSKYLYRDCKVSLADGKAECSVTPVETLYEFKVDRKVPRLGLMLVGWGGNNGSTLTASILANKKEMSWMTKEGVQKATYFGSISQASTLRIGSDETGADVFVPFNKILPMVNPNDLVLGGWDISGLNLAESMKRAKVLEYDLQRQLYDEMEKLVPLPSVYSPDFIALNQADRADNVIKGTMSEQLERIRSDIREFKAANSLDQVIVLWTANTERYADILSGVNDTADNILKSIKNGHSEISPSCLFAVASILEGHAFINGSPQNTFVPGVIELASTRKVYIGGDDFKSGQTKMKSVLVDFLVNAGIKPLSIVSYNHLGNNDGKNLDEQKQFRSKEISKSNVVDDMVASNPLLYSPDEHPDHTVVIKYCPAVADSKRAMDEYVSEIFMGGRSTISLYNVCEDSLLASPLIIDLAVITELFSRIQFRTNGEEKFHGFNSVLSVLSYMLKAPLVPEGTNVVNALAKQRAALENIMKACVGLPPSSEMAMDDRL